MSASLSALLLLAVCAGAFVAWWIFCLRHIDAFGFGARASPHGPTHVFRNRGRVVFAGAGVPAPASLRFEVKAENALDRLAKRLGISVEGQMGHPAFDRAFYLMCDDPMTLAAMQGNRALHAALLDLVGGQVPAGFRFAGLRCADGMLHAQYRNARWVRDVDPDKLMGGLQLRLQRIAQQLPLRGGDTAPADRRRRDTYLVTTASFGALFVGAIGSLWIQYSGLPQVIDRAALWWAAAALAALAVVAGWRWIWPRLGRTSRAHLALLQLVLIGAPGALLCAMILVRQLDIGLDPWAPVARTALSSQYRVHTYRRLPDRYSIDVQTMNALTQDPAPDYAATLKLDAPQAREAGMGFVRVVEHRGAFGLRWVERVTRDDVMAGQLERELRKRP